MGKINRNSTNIHKVMTLCQLALLGFKGLNHKGIRMSGSVVLHEIMHQRAGVSLRAGNQAN